MKKIKKTKIFFITTELPSRQGGSNVRNFNIIKYLKKESFYISLFTILDNKTKNILPSVEKELNLPIYYVLKPSLSPLKQLFYTLTQEVTPHMKEYEISGIADLVLKKIRKEKPDIIHIEQLNTYYAIRKIIPYLKRNNIKIIFGQHNVEHVAFSEGIKSMPMIKKLLGKFLLSNFIHLEYEALNNVDHILVCSEIDKKYFQNKLNLNNITVIPNGVDCNYFSSTPFINENSLLFMGGVSYPPNNEALQYYFSKIHPKLKKSVKDLSAYILGGNPPKWLINLSHKDTTIHITNHVADVRVYLKKAKICICPIQSGSGTRLKILEYLGSGKAVISTSKGAEGINITNGKNILLADTSQEFTNKILTLFAQPDKIKALGEEGRKLTMNNYQWKKIVKDIEKVYEYEK